MNQITLADIIPYPDETTFSIQARLRVRFAVKSPKALIEGVYNNRTISASWVLPSHLQRLLDETINVQGLTAEKLVFKHTLFPLIAPFIPVNRSRKILDSMESGNGAGLHVMSGFAASRIPKSLHLRFCPNCAREQHAHYGEPYFMRIHQIPALTICYKHKVELGVVSGFKKGVHRHEFVPLTLNNITSDKAVKVSKYDNIISLACEALLNSESLPSPSYAQWTNYYRQLVCKHDLSKGAYVDYLPLKEKVESFWSPQVLQCLGLNVSRSQSSWLHCIFRKHRKSFSYLEHIVVNAALLNESFNIIECIERAAERPKSFRKRDSFSSSPSTSSQHVLSADKLVWAALLKTQTPKIARSKSPALYTRLYRANREWLLEINEGHRAKRVTVNNRVNWRKRDFAIVKTLFRIIPKVDLDLSLPRATKRWLILQLNNTSMVEKYARKLPLTSLFLSRYAESISQYQIRRITYQLLTNRHPYITRRWFLLRASGLSEERMTVLTKQFMEDLGEMLPPFDLESLSNFKNLINANKWLE
jgi:hypothetical protein